jgi:hypothetical protein
LEPRENPCNGKRKPPSKRGLKKSKSLSTLDTSQLENRGSNSAPSSAPKGKPGKGQRKPPAKRGIKPNKSMPHMQKKPMKEKVDYPDLGDNISDIESDNE